MGDRLSGKKIAIVVTDGFEQVELTSPRAALEREGATTEIVSPKRAGDQVKGWNHIDWGDPVVVDVSIDHAHEADYDALLLPGGVMNPDRLRTIPAVRRFVRRFFDHQKPVAAICHGPWTLIDSEVVEGRQVTSWPSLRRDLENAGALWIDQDVVKDAEGGGLVTSRKPADLPAFNEAICELFSDVGVNEETDELLEEAPRRMRPSP
jgi:protease I